MNNGRKIPIIFNGALLVWFSLCMFGVSFGNNILVTRSYKDDGLFFIIFAAIFMWFMFRDKIGKYVISGWLFMWFATQFFSHWYFTIFGPWEGKNEYFSDTIKLIPSSKVYVPDLYHIVLHIFIICAFISTIIYCINSIKEKKFIDNIKLSCYTVNKIER